MFNKNKITSIPSGFGYKKPSALRYGDKKPASAGGKLLVGDGITYPILKNGKSVNLIVTGDLRDNKFIGTEAGKPYSSLKPETKPKSNITGALGSDLRKAQYDAKGWKYDDTIKGHNRDGTRSSTTVTPAASTTKSGSINFDTSGITNSLKKSAANTSYSNTLDFGTFTTPKSKSTKEVRKEGRADRKKLRSGALTPTKDVTVTKKDPLSGVSRESTTKKEMTKREAIKDSRDKQKKANKAKRKASRVIKK